MSVYRKRRTIALLFIVVSTFLLILSHPDMYRPAVTQNPKLTDDTVTLLNQLPVKGRAPKTDYRRTQFGDGWALIGGCDMRNIILARDLKQPIIGTNCKVTAGELNDPYTGKLIHFERGTDTSDDVQIDHVVALSNAWQTGAQQISAAKREALANDPLELLAVEGQANQDKGDGDAATWLPSNKAFRCQYVARQVAVKKKYQLWVTPAEKEAIHRVLDACV